MLALLSIFNTHPKIINITKPCMKMEILRDWDIININNNSIDLFISTQIHEYAGTIELKFKQNTTLSRINLSYGDSIKIESPTNMKITYTGRGGAKVYIWVLPHDYCGNYNIISINQKNGMINFSNSLKHPSICWFTSFNTNVSYMAYFESRNNTAFYNIIDNSLMQTSFLSVKSNREDKGILGEMQLARLKDIDCPLNFTVNYTTSMSYGDWTDTPRFFQTYSRNMLLKNNNSNPYIIAERSVDVRIWIVSFGFVAICYTITFIILFILPKYKHDSKGSKLD